MVDLRRVPLHLAGTADGVGIVADELQVEHGRATLGAARGLVKGLVGEAVGGVGLSWDPAGQAVATALAEMLDCEALHGPRLTPRGERLFLHSSRVPLAEADIDSAEDKGQLNLFENECEGLCGT